MEVLRSLYSLRKQTQTINLFYFYSSYVYSFRWYARYLTSSFFSFFISKLKLLFSEVRRYYDEVISLDSALNDLVEVLKPNNRNTPHLTTTLHLTSLHHHHNKHQQNWHFFLQAMYANTLQNLNSTNFDESERIWTQIADKYPKLLLLLLFLRCCYYSVILFYFWHNSNIISKKTTILLYFQAKALLITVRSQNY